MTNFDSRSDGRRPSGDVGHRPRRRDDQHPGPAVHGTAGSSRRAARRGRPRHGARRSGRSPGGRRRPARLDRARSAGRGGATRSSEAVPRTGRRGARPDRRRGRHALVGGRAGRRPARPRRRRGSTSWPAASASVDLAGVADAADPVRARGAHPGGRRARRLGRGRRDARRGVRDPRGLRGTWSPTAGSAPGQGRSFLWPGSHTKLVEVDAAGRIVAEPHDAGRRDAPGAGAAHAAGGEPARGPARRPRPGRRGRRRPPGRARRAGPRRVPGPGRRADRGASTRRGRASFWIGAVVADDVARLADHPILAPGRPVWVGGRQPLRALYAAGLARRHAGPVVALDDPLAEAASALVPPRSRPGGRILDGVTRGYEGGSPP